MNDHDSNNEASVDNSLCRLIAWLSVVVLAAGWGSNIDPQWRPIWREFGTFGLVSAVGLHAARRLHGNLRRRRDQRTVENLLSRRLATEAAASEVTGMLPNPAIEKLFAEFDSDGSSRSDRRLGTSGHPPARLFIFDPSNTRPVDATRPDLVAQIRNISLSGIGLSHSESIEPGQFLLHYTTRDGEQLVVGVELHWCRPSGDNTFISGGRFAECGVPTGAPDDASGVLV